MDRIENFKAILIGYHINMKIRNADIKDYKIIAENNLKLAKESENIEVACIQRLGYLLETFSGERIVLPLHKCFQKHKTRWISLRSDVPINNMEKDEKWKIIVNEKIETDL